MSLEAYQSAETAIEDAAATCRAILERLDNHLLTPDEARSSVAEPMKELMESFDAAFTSAPDPRDDTRVLLARMGSALDEVADLLERHPQLPLDAANRVRDTKAWIEHRARHQDERVRLMATVTAWEEREPTLAPLRLRRAALETLDQAADEIISEEFLTRLVRAGLRAFGPRWAVNLAAHYLDAHLSNREYWSLVVVALDELAAWGSATELGEIPADFQSRAIMALIEIAGHPELADHAIMRIPLHRLRMAERHELAELMADRNAVMPIDWINEPDQHGSLAIEVAYLRALDAAANSWPGKQVEG